MFVIVVAFSSFTWNTNINCVCRSVYRNNSTDEMLLWAEYVFLLSVPRSDCRCRRQCAHVNCLAYFSHCIHQMNNDNNIYINSTHADCIKRKYFRKQVFALCAMAVECIHIYVYWNIYVHILHMGDTSFRGCVCVSEWVYLPLLFTPQIQKVWTMELRGVALQAICRQYFFLTLITIPSTSNSISSTNNNNKNITKVALKKLEAF